jgi:signal transduction histidine kinase
MSEGAGSGGPLTFPDQPRLALDQLLAQLVERAGEVMSTQGRLRGLLAANQLIIADLSLPAVLRHIAEAARELIGARYAALGVIAPGGGLAEFIHVGMPDEVIAEIGHLPEGKGLLGALIAEPHPIRLSQISDDPRSSGFPAAHPPMSSFLGVPIRVREEVFGNLYLAESAHGEFSAEDGQLATALAATAAVAIDNARLFEAATSRGEWLTASALITRELLSADAAEAVSPLRTIARRSLEIGRADLVVVLLPCPDDEAGLRVEVAVGEGAEELVGESIPVSGTLAGRVFVSGEPVRVASREEVPGLDAPVLDTPATGPILVLPLLGSARVHGVLTVCRLVGRPAFTLDDLQMAFGFASHAAVAIELADARAEQQQSIMLEERERIAADLHDHVIQRLFAAGLTLQGVAVGLPQGRDAQRIAGTVDDLDATISQIRNTIFRLQRLPRQRESGVRGRVLDVIDDVARALGFQPTIRLSGPLDYLLAGDTVVEDLIAVIREALTNVARHADAASAAVDLTAGADHLVLTVEDDGRGIESGGHRSGLANMQRRAEHHGGSLTVSSRAPSGTRLTWSVPAPVARGTRPRTS